MSKKHPNKKLTCKLCSKEFEVYFHIWKRNGTRFCSQKCGNASRIGTSSWNKGLMGWRKGEKHPWMPSGEKHWSYKAENVEYGGLHQWVRKNLGSAKRCTHCGLDRIPEGMKRYFQWANRSHLYRRDLNDWMQLCVKCHKAYDMAYRKVKTKSQC